MKKGKFCTIHNAFLLSTTNAQQKISKKGQKKKNQMIDDSQNNHRTRLFLNWQLSTQDFLPCTLHKKGVDPDYFFLFLFLFFQGMRKKQGDGKKGRETFEISGM